MDGARRGNSFSLDLYRKAGATEDIREGREETSARDNWFFPPVARGDDPRVSTREGWRASSVTRSITPTRPGAQERARGERRKFRERSKLSRVSSAKESIRGYKTRRKTGALGADFIVSPVVDTTPRLLRLR